jgi:hypothetical protein
MFGQLRPASDKIMLEMLKIGTSDHRYPVLKKEWLELVDAEWNRLERIFSVEEQQALLSGAETETARNIERLSNG